MQAAEPPVPLKVANWPFSCLPIGGRRAARGAATDSDSPSLGEREREKLVLSPPQTVGPSRRSLEIAVVTPLSRCQQMTGVLIAIGSVPRTGPFLLTGDSADGRRAMTPAQILSLLVTQLLRQLEGRRPGGLVTVAPALEDPPDRSTSFRESPLRAAMARCPNWRPCHMLPAKFLRGISPRRRAKRQVGEAPPYFSLEILFGSGKERRFSFTSRTGAWRGFPDWAWGWGLGEKAGKADPRHQPSLYFNDYRREQWGLACLYS